MAFFSPSTRPLAWAGFVLIGFSCVWLVVLLVVGIGPDDEAESVDSSTAAASAPSGADANTQAARPTPLATAPLTPSAAVPSALQTTQRLDERPAASAPDWPAAATNPAASQTPGLSPSTAPAASSAPAQGTAASTAASPLRSVASAESTYAPTAPPPRLQQTASGPSPRELTQGLAVRGHTVHASVSGHTASTTLSVSGRTLTRSDCIEWLADPKTRSGLRAAGVRVVVATNGAQSWTFML